VVSTTTAGNFGPFFVEAPGFDHWAFQLTGTWTGFTATIYGTLDPTVLSGPALANTSYPTPGSAGAAWVLLYGPSETAGAPQANPLTAITQLLESKIPWLAIYVVITTSTPTGTCNVVGWAVD
jgi:hypothetical protein